MRCLCFVVVVVMAAAFAAADMVDPFVLRVVADIVAALGEALARSGL